jgi:hypothetical protein
VYLPGRRIESREGWFCLMRAGQEVKRGVQ